VATHQEIGSQLWAREIPDSNPGLQDNSLTLPLSHYTYTSSIEPPQNLLLLGTVPQKLFYITYEDDMSPRLLRSPYILRENILVKKAEKKIFLSKCLGKEDKHITEN
jgi:hypothetical protein